MVKSKDISLSIVRTIKASPQKVFAAWTEPKTLKQWMSPSPDMDVAIAETDLRIGGRYRIVMREKDGKEHRVGGVYREILPHERIVFTWAWESSPEEETLVTIELRSLGVVTELTLTHARFTTDKARDMHNHGWVGCLNRLETLFTA
jgi:uncharacterized protein YndB with AHSA1/START domain